MLEQHREVDQAVTALTAEVLKLSPVEGEARELLTTTIENAFARLAQAILAQSTGNVNALTSCATE